MCNGDPYRSDVLLISINSTGDDFLIESPADNHQDARNKPASEPLLSQIDDLVAKADELLAETDSALGNTQKLRLGAELVRRDILSLRRWVEAAREASPILTDRHGSGKII